MASDKKTPPDSEFSIEDFFSEIEKAEDIEASKRLPQERLKNKRRLDREDAKRATTKTSFPDTPTGMSPKSPKSKANPVDRPTNLDGFAEPAQAGFHHQPSSKTPTGDNTGGGAGESPARADGGINQKAGGAGQPAGVRQKRAPARADGGANKRDGGAAQPTSDGITATVAALQNLIEHGREV
ncbi:hypothetical protein MNBD_ALPHA11-221, partial [hydrothermal vent metagenome]